MAVKKMVKTDKKLIQEYENLVDTLQQENTFLKHQNEDLSQRLDKKDEEYDQLKKNLIMNLSWCQS